MNEPEFDSAPPMPRPRTTTVLALLAVTAAILSYLGAYAMANALVKAEMITPWPPGNDPRPRWFIIGFAILMGIFFTVGTLARSASGRYLRRIDEMETSGNDG
ncbi:MAG TPA: hypothetical protein VKK61_04330 [Tepidisphaeraceae bacterium]|nr:hypothetical protein [Tepidisphaeraceae bacterium]